jgi:hypothetical protein
MSRFRSTKRAKELKRQERHRAKEARKRERRQSPGGDPAGDDDIDWSQAVGFPPAESPGGDAAQGEAAEDADEAAETDEDDEAAEDDGAAEDRTSR